MISVGVLVGFGLGALFISGVWVLVLGFSDRRQARRHANRSPDAEPVTSATGLLARAVVVDYEDPYPRNQGWDW